MNKDETCQELKDIRYKTMFITGNKQTNTNITDTSEADIGIMLDKELKQNKSEPWSKLNKTAKITKIKNYTSDYSIVKDITSDEKKELEKYLINAMDRKRLTSIKDVTYDKETGVIKTIPSLSFNHATRKFTLKRNDKRTSTIKHLTPDSKKKKDSSKDKKVRLKKENVKEQ
jgi:hypothetical protein|tara:strand:+ start:825 stop:1340 length:516 start_codon:yes stop_codon:yes gene_type:complete